MESVSRRSFLAVSAGAAGTAVLTFVPKAGATEPVGSSDSDAMSGPAPTDLTGVVLHVRNSTTGEVALYANDKEMVVKDRALIDAIARASRSGKN